MYKYNSIHLNNLKAMSGLSTRVCKVNSLNLNLDTYFMYISCNDVLLLEHIYQATFAFFPYI